MTGHAYTEGKLVEQPAIALFAELGWQTVSAMEEVFGTGGTLGRETSGEVVLVSRLRATPKMDMTDMAVVVSPGQNEIEQMKKLGLDIVPHRKRMNESQPGLDEKFKDPDDPLRLVFLCAKEQVQQFHG